jgi:hypothetical protein
MRDVTGTAIFAFPHCWGSEPVLRLQFVTSIQQGATGSETRDALLTVPRLGVQYDVENSLAHADLRRLERILRNSLGNRLVVPLCTEAVRIQSIADDTITTAAAVTNRLFTATRYAVVLDADGQTAAVYELSSASGTTLVASENIAADFAEGDLVAPAIVTAPIGAQQALELQTSYVGAGRVDWREDPAESVAVPFVYSAPAFGGLSVFPLPFTWGAVGQTHRRLLVERSTETLVSELDAMARSAQDVRGQLALETRELIARAALFFADARGRFSRFWMPTNKRDFVVAATTTASNLVEVEPTGFADDWAAQEASDYRRRFLLIRDVTNAAWYARRITNVTTLENGNERLTLNSAVANADAASHLSFLLLSRFAQDDLELAFADTDHARADIETTELVAEYSSFAAIAAASGTINADEVLLP